MILIAPDKFKGTLTARQAVDIIAKVIAQNHPRQLYIKAPMADGGEGTADVICRGPQWVRHDVYYVNPASRTAVIDSSAVIGLSMVDRARHDILKASSAPLGVKVREILSGGCDRVVIGIGGTATCDGGMGFVDALGHEKRHSYRDRLLGLSDVQVPLVAPVGQPSALMFAPQKGASPIDIRILHDRLLRLRRELHCGESPYDGAGGGLGFAIASVIGAPCVSGAEYVLDSYDIDWTKVKLVITGEGSYDAQTACGKVVDVVSRRATAHDVPTLVLAGTVAGACKTDSPLINIAACDHFLPDAPLTPEVAAQRLEMCAAAAISDYQSSHKLARRSRTGSFQLPSIESL